MTVNESDLRSRLHALPGELPPRRLGRVPDTVRAGARRRRTRARLTTALVVVLVGIGIPLGVLASLPSGATTRAGVTAAVPTRAAFGGVSVTWLPAGATHLGSFSRPQSDSSADWPGDFPRLAWATVGSNSESYYAREYSAAGVSATPAPDAVADRLWVTVSWHPAADPGTVAFIAAGLPQLAQQQLLGDVTTNPRTVNGRAAVLAVDDLATVPTGDSNDQSAVEDGRRYDTALIWTTPAGVTLTVESLTTTPANPAVLRRVAEGLVPATHPPAPTRPTRPDAATSAAVRSAFHDVFTGGLPASRFAAAAQDGAALTATRAQVFTRFPGLANTLTVGVGTLTQVDADIVRATLTLTFADSDIPVTTYQISGQATRVAGGWKIARATFCDTVIQLSASGLSCPPS